MMRTGPAALAALALALMGGPVQATAPAFAPPAADPLASLFVRFFYEWKAEPKDLQVSDLRVLKAGGELRVLCGDYVLPGQPSRPFLVMGDATPKAQAAWEPGSFPDSDPLYPQLMDNLRLCQRLGAAVSAS